MGDWSIVYVQKPLGVAVHGIIEVRDDQGKVVYSMEGLAVGADGRQKPIGTQETDRIKFFFENGTSANADYSTFAPQEVESGSQQYIMSLVQLGIAAGSAISQKNIGYPPFGVFSSNQSNGVSNSNAVISTLFKAMGLEEPFPDKPAPGRGTLLLSTDEINGIRTSAGFQKINFDGGLWLQQDTNGFLWTSIGTEDSGPLIRIGNDGTGVISDSHGTIANLTASDVIEVGAQSDGSPSVILAPDDSGVSRSIVVDERTGSASVQVAGDTLLTASIGSQVSVTGQSITVQQTQDGWTTTTTASDGSISVLLSKPSDGISFGLGQDALTGKLQINSANLDGQTFSGGSFQDWLAVTQGTVNDGQASSGLSGVSTQLTTDFSNIASGNTTGLDTDTASLVALSVLMDNNVHSANYLGQRIGYGNVSDRWVQSFIGAPPNSTVSSVLLTMASAYNPGVAFAQSQILSFAVLPPPPSVWIVEVYIGYDVGDHYPPLVLDLDGHGIDLVAQNKSTAHFDVHNDGSRPQVSWVGSSNGFLVFDRNHNGIVDNASEWFGDSFTKDGSAPQPGLNGFSALATLATTGATTFSKATSLIDSATGKSYFDEVQLWVDANQDGITDAGELHSLADFSISSINLSAQSVGKVVNGNLVMSSGAYTLSDGTQRTIDDIGLTTQAPTTSSSSGLSAATLAFAELVAKGMPALAAGQAQAVSAKMASLPVSFSAEFAAIQQWSGSRLIIIDGYPLFNELVGDPTQVNFLSWPSGYPRVGHTVPLPAPQNVEAALSAITAAASAVKSGANALSGGATALSAAQLSALTEDLDPTSAHAADASTKAAQASVALGNAVSSVVNANTAIVNAGNLIATATNLLAQIVPVNYETSGNVANGSSYASPGDAFLASASFAGLESGLKAFASVKDAEKQVLSAFAQAGNYGAVLIGGSGATLTAGSQRTLFLAGSGSQTLVGGSEHDDFAFTTASGTATIQGFSAGPTGDTLEFLNVGSGVTVGDDGHGGSVITYGSGQSVDVIGVLPSQLNLYTNIVGVDTVSFASTQSAGTRTLGGSQPVFYDGQQHVRSLTASNYGDVLIGNSAGNTLIGGLGNDTLEGYGGADTLDGKSGVNAVSYAWSSTGITANLLAGTDSTGSTLFNLQNITGSGQGDVLTGDGNNNILDGNSGSDTLVGGGGNDTYVFKAGYGQLKISNGVVANGVPSGTLALGAGIAPDNLWFSRSGNDLVLQLLGTTDRVTVQGWYSDAYRELLSIKLASGLQIGAQTVNNLVQSLATYQSANPTFDPAEAHGLPAGLSLASYFTTQPITGAVPVAPNVKLITQQADLAGTAGTSAAQISQFKTSLDSKLAALSSANNAVVNWSTQPKPLTGGVAYYIYPATPYPRVMVIWHNDLNGGYTIPAGGQQIYSISSDTLYFYQWMKYTNPDLSSPVGYSIAIVSTTAIGSAISAINQVYSSIASIGSLEQDLAAAGNARQTALHAAVLANTSTAGSSQATTARAAATDAEAAIGTAISRYYNAVLVNLPAATAALQANQTMLSGLVPQTTTTTGYFGTVTTYAPYTSTDQSQIVAMNSAQSAAAAAVSSANSAVGSFISAYASLEGYGSVQLAGSGGNLTAQANGDFLIAAGPGHHTFWGNSGADLFAFGNWNDTSGAEVLSFQTGVAADRLLVVPTSGDRTIYFTEDTNLNAGVTFLLSSGLVDTVKLTGVTLGSISLYDNIIGVYNASYQSVGHGMTVSLASVTPRDYDGSSHIRNLTGSNYDDVLTGDQQDNYIFGGSGNDTIMGGAGNDTLDGGNGINTVSFADNPNSVSVELWRGTAETGYGGNDILSHVQNVIGSDHGDVLNGDANDNVLTGGAGNDTLDGGVGHDTLIGGGGDDIYWYNYSSLTIVNGVTSNAGPTGQLQLSSALQPSSLWFSRSGDDLVIDNLGQSSPITVKGWFANTYRQLEYLVLPDGSKITSSAVNGLVTAMAAYSAAHPGYNPQASNLMPSDPALTDALNTYWARTLTAVNGSVGPVYFGNNTMVGGAGIDTATFHGNAADYVIRTDSSGVTSVIDSVAGRDGANTLKGIEYLKFADRIDAPPIAHDDSGTAALDASVTLSAASLLANDSDRDTGDGKSIVSVSAKSALGAAVTIRNGDVVYDPRAAAALHGIGAGQSLTDSFTYTMRDSAGAISTATVTMTVNGVNAAGVPAGTYRVGSEFLVNTTTAGAQTVPTITGLTNGNFVVSWQNTGAPIKAQLFNSAGDKIGGEFSVGPGQTNPSISALANGGFIATWEGYGIGAQLFDATGATVGSVLRIDQTGYAGSAQVKPTVTGLPNGGFVVTWQDGFYDGEDYHFGTTSAFSIKGRVFDRNGSPIGDQFQVNAPTGSYEQTPAVAGLTGGGFVVTWQNDNAGIKAQLFDANGVKLGSEMTVTGTEVNQLMPRITSLTNGGFAVTWWDNQHNAIDIQTFDASGNKVGSQSQIALPPAYTLYFAMPAIAATNGGFVVTWKESGTSYGDSSGSSIMAQEFDGSGNKIGSEFLVNTQTAGYQINPVVAGLSGGGFAISWQDGSLDLGTQGSNTLGDSSLTSIKAQVFGMSFGNTVQGTSGNDMLSATGPSTLVGGGGNDTYRLDQTQSSSIIVNGTSDSAAPSGVLQFGAVGSNQLWFDHAGMDLAIEVLGTNQKVTVQNWFGTPGAQLGSIQAGNSVIQNNQLSALVQAMATFESGYAGSHGGMAFDPTSSGPTIVDTSVLAAVSSAWHQSA